MQFSLFSLLSLCRQRKTFRRKDGTFIYFEDSAGVIVNNKGEMKGSAITGTVPIGPVLFNVVDPERFFLSGSEFEGSFGFGSCMNFFLLSVNQTPPRKSCAANFHFITEFTTIYKVFYSVADPGCLSRIRIFSIRDAGSRFKKIPGS
jgi:hypothetical protein